MKINQVKSKERVKKYGEVYTRMQDVYLGNLQITIQVNKQKLTLKQLNELYDESGKEWSKTPIPLVKEKSKKDAWKDMPIEAINYLKSLPEFDAEIFKEITGIEV